MKNPIPERVDPATLLGWLRSPDAVTAIDARTPTEFEAAHIAGSYNVPLDLLGEHAAQLAARLDREVGLVCQSGAPPPKPGSAAPASAPIGCTAVTGERWNARCALSLGCSSWPVPLRTCG